MQKQKQLLILFVVMVFSGTGFSQSNYSLQKALQTARSNNPVLKNQSYTINIAESDAVTAKMRPNLTLGFNYIGVLGQQYQVANTGTLNGANTQANFQLGKVFQLPGMRKNKIDLANQNTDLAHKNYAETERNLYQDVALKWLDVWTSQKQLEIVEKAKNNLDSLVIINKVRLKNEVITETDFNRTQLLANQYGLQIKSSEQNYRNELTELKYLLGSTEEITVDSKDGFNFIVLSSLNDFLNEAMEKRTDVQAAKSLIDAADTNIKLQRSMAYPQPELGVIYNPQNAIPYAGVYGTVDIPIFSRNQGEIKKSKYLKLQAEQGLEITHAQIQTEITNAYQTYQTEKENVRNFDVLLPQSEAILKSVRYSYLRGGTTIIDFLEAQRSWLETQQQYYDTMQHYRESYIKLLYTSGLINQIAQ
ncbi:TolC family protein [Flavobacterium kingsejongi]|uniref:Transporter n=1 Tax=Flavobacterium kingsejongi TaxID=1678728 RepID=A0A2S1LUG1_9FLAO|nr:TolC family protein [Flavobacterium kingsejongi]AWG27348.1 transporter [Flavobacterium kingsejongi]